MDDEVRMPAIARYMTSTAQDMKTSIRMMYDLLEALPPGEGARDEPVYGQLLHTLRYTERLNDSLVQWLALYRKGGRHRSLFAPELQGVDVLAARLLAEESEPLAYAGVALALDYDPDLLWDYDASLLCGVLHHAIHNAMHYAQGKVRVALAQRGDSLEVRVEDDGPGFPQAMLDAGQAALSGTYQGVNFATRSTGLGLYFSREAVGLHRRFGRQGSAHLANGGAYGGGCFILLLP
jgi:two-component system sensor histidine kinase SenX3